MKIRLMLLSMLSGSISIFAMNSFDTDRVLWGIQQGALEELMELIKSNKIDLSSNKEQAKQIFARADESKHWPIAQLFATHILTQSVPSQESPLFFLRCGALIAGGDQMFGEYGIGIYQTNIDKLCALLPTPTHHGDEIAGLSHEQFRSALFRNYRGLKAALSSNNDVMRHAIIKLFMAQDTPLFSFKKHARITQHLPAIAQENEKERKAEMDKYIVEPDEDDLEPEST